MTDRGMAQSLETSHAREAETSPALSRGTPLGAVLAIAGVCLLMALMSAADTLFVTNHHGDPLPLSVILSATAPRWILFAIALPVILHLTLKRPPWPLALGTFALHLGIFLTLTAAHAYVHAWAGRGLLPYGFLFGFHIHAARVWINSTPLLIPLYGATLLTAWSIQQMRERRARALRESQLETQLHAARLAALRAQLHPHFLYNTLNGIAALVNDRQPAQASRALEQLAELLHAAFRDDGRELIPLSEEVALAERYLALQQLRFGTRLHCDVSLTSEAAAVAVPPLILQPLVENAVVHGLARRSGPMRLTLDARLERGRVRVIIAHDGPELPVDWVAASRGGVGLRNTRARLASSFGSAAQLIVRRRAGGGVESIVEIPAPVPAAEPEVPSELQPA
ncbi:MAG: histidine kinase [Gemmatimonadota bacterium]